MFGEVRIALETVQLIIDEQVFHKWTEFPQKQCSDGGNDNKNTEDHHQRINLKITPEQITISSPCYSSKTIYLLPSNLQLLPSTCSTADWIKGDGLHLRFKVSWSRPPEVSSNDQEEIPADHVHNACIVCKSCRQEVTRTIRRISPMPSDDWEGIVEELWCCSSKDVAGVPPDLKMSPEKDECLSGSFQYVLSDFQLLGESVIMTNIDSARPGKKPSKRVECSRCRSIIGNGLRVAEEKPSSISLWKFQTTFICDSIKSVSLEQLVVRYIRNQTKIQPTFKFMLENEDHEAQVLLWLISPDSLLLSTEEPDHSTEMKVGVSSAVMNIHCSSIMKLLYKTCWDKKGNSMKDEWSRDMMVHSFVLPTSACHQIADILVESTRHTPPSMRRMNDLFIGYLKTS